MSDCLRDDRMFLELNNVGAIRERNVDFTLQESIIFSSTSSSDPLSLASKIRQPKTSSVYAQLQDRPFPAAQMATKVKGLLKGLRYISQIFEPTKEQEMQIGYPTDVKHVAHIGWDGPSVNPPSWMNKFRAVPEFSSAPLSSTGEAKEPSPAKSASQDLNRIFGIQDSPTRDSPELPRPSRRRLSSSTPPHDSSTKKQSRRHQSAGISINSPAPDLDGDAPKPMRRHHNSGLKSELSSQDPLRAPRQSRRKKSKGSSGGDGGSTTSKALNSFAESGPDLEDIEKLRALDLKEDERV